MLPIDNLPTLAKKRNDSDAARLNKRKKKNNRGVSMASKLPTINPVLKCRLKALKTERIKDYLLMEEEFIRNQEQIKKEKQDRNEEVEVDEER
jgi:26S proteasome regulatory subunit T2